MLTAPRAMCLWGTDSPSFSSSQPHHHAMPLTGDAKGIKGRVSPLYLSQLHCLVYREEIIHVVLWSKLFFFCFNTLSFKVLRYTGWRMGTNLKLVMTNCSVFTFAVFLFASAFWIFYLNIRPKPGAAKPLWPAERAGMFSTSSWLLNVFTAISFLASAARLFSCTTYL